MTPEGRAWLGLGGLLVLSGCDRVCGDLCYQDGGADAGDGHAESPDATLDAGAADASPESADAAPEAGVGCPTQFEELARVDLVEAGLLGSNFNPVFPGAIAFGRDGAFWFAAAAAAPSRRFGRVAWLGDGGAALRFFDASSETVPVAVAASDDGTWFTLTGRGPMASVPALARIGNADSGVEIAAVNSTASLRSGLSVDRDRRLWWIEQYDNATDAASTSLAWTDRDASAGPVLVSGAGLSSLTALSSDDAGFTWFTGVSATRVQTNTVFVPVFGRAIPTAVDYAPSPGPLDGAAERATLGDIAVSSDGAAWFLVFSATGPGALVEATDLDAAARFDFAPDEGGTPQRIAPWSSACGVLVTRDAFGPLRLVSPDGSMADLASLDGSLLGPAGAIAVGDVATAVVITNPPAIVLLRLVSPSP